jgi:hypothetical protein
MLQTETHVSNSLPQADTRVQNDAMLLPAGVWRRVFRVVWVLLALNSIWTFAWTLYLTRQFVDNPPARIAQGLVELGWTSDFYFWFNVVFISIYYGVFFAIALVIFLLRPHERMALFSAVFLLAFGAANAYIPAPEYITFWVTAPISYITTYLLINMLSWPLLVLFFALFPNGRFAPKWIRYIALYGFSFSVAWGLFPQAFATPSGWFLVVVILSIIIVFGASLYAQVWRYRHYSTPLQRQQTKWLVYGLALIVIVTLAQIVTTLIVLPSSSPPPGLTVFLDLVGVVGNLAYVLIPISVGFAILRYRLWDIDVLIRRTLTYGILTALLVGIYFGSVVALQRIFALVTGGQQNEIVTVVSTLAIAALFIPLRNKIQELIDRRFYRKKYDAQQVLARFSEAVRDETDLEQLTARLMQVVDETMQPTKVSVWLKSSQVNDTQRRVPQDNATELSLPRQASSNQVR